MSLSMTLIGGPTALIEIDGFRLLTDPTFDAPRTYQLGHVTLEKLSGPALAEDTIGEIDAVLLSHDQHADNLDESGKHFLPKAKRVLTTEVGAKRRIVQERAFVDHHGDACTPWPGGNRAARG
jgi:L-ascorbate metabolism protein UlaG (beta-lactamase superfamily)